MRVVLVHGTFSLPSGTQAPEHKTLIELVDLCDDDVSLKGEVDRVSYEHQGAGLTCIPHHYSSPVALPPTNYVAKPLPRGDGYLGG